MTPDLTCRLMQDEDLGALLRLWEEESGWGSLTPETWREWFVDTPHGECVVAVAATEDNDIVAQLVLTPTKVVVGEDEVPALRLSAPVLASSLRLGVARDPDHPVIGMFRVAVGAAVQRGCRLMYALPRRSWLALFRWAARSGLGQCLTASYPCLASTPASVASETFGEGARFSARIADGFGPDYGSLWTSAREGLPVTCGVVREPKWLQWRLGDHTVVEVRDNEDDALAGYAAVRNSDVLLCDLLARNPDDIELVLSAVLHIRSSGATSDDGPPSLKAMRTPALAPALESLAFAPVDFEFAFVCYALDPSLSAEMIAPDRWYIMPGD